jgi:hypothetical protein
VLPETLALLPFSRPHPALANLNILYYRLAKKSIPREIKLKAAESRKIYRYGKKSFAVIDKKVKKSYTIANSMFKQREGGSCALPRTKEGEK